MQDYKQLIVWQKSHTFALQLYKETKLFPKEEMYGITSHMRRSALSIPANIAEGSGKATDSDFGRFLQISFGSACELEYHLILAGDLRYLDAEILSSIQFDLEEIKKMLASLISKIRPSRTSRPLSADR